MPTSSVVAPASTDTVPRLRRPPAAVDGAAGPRRSAWPRRHCRRCACSRSPCWPARSSCSAPPSRNDRDDGCRRRDRVRSRAVCSAGVVFSLGLLLVVVGGRRAVHRQQPARHGLGRPGGSPPEPCSAELGDRLRRKLRRRGSPTAWLIHARSPAVPGDGGGAVGRQALDHRRGEVVTWGSTKRSLGASWPTCSSGSPCGCASLGVQRSPTSCSAIVFPITAFVAAGFEHSVANMYFLPLALFIKADAPDRSGLPRACRRTLMPT